MDCMGRTHLAQDMDCLLADSCEHNNEASGSLKGEEFAVCFRVKGLYVC